MPAAATSLKLTSTNPRIRLDDCASFKGNDSFKASKSKKVTVKVK